MAWSAAKKLRRIVTNVTGIMAIELVVAARAIELREAAPARATGAVISRLREVVSGIGPDRFVSPELAAAAAFVRSGAAVAAATDVVGELE